jgi:hypothetical protein
MPRLYIVDDRMISEYEAAGETEVLEKNRSHCNFVHHKSH